MKYFFKTHLECIVLSSVYKQENYLSGWYSDLVTSLYLWNYLNSIIQIYWEQVCETLEFENADNNKHVVDFAELA